VTSPATSRFWDAPWAGVPAPSPRADLRRLALRRLSGGFPVLGRWGRLRWGGPRWQRPRAWRTSKTAGSRWSTRSG